MRVCFVVNNLSYGGAESEVVELALEQRRRGNQVDLVTLLPNVAHVELLKEAGVSLHQLRFRKLGLPKFLSNLQKLIRNVSPDIVHSHLYHSNIGCRLALRGSFPLVSTIHNSSEKHWSRYAIYRATERWSDLSTIVSEAGRSSFLAAGKVGRPARLRVVRNGIAVPTSGQDAAIRIRTRETLDLTDQFVWIAVGRHVPNKNYPLLIGSFAEHLKRAPKAVLLMVGDGYLRASLEEQARGLPIKFLGNRNDVPDLFAAADAHVMSSRLEGLPMVLLEASQVGLVSVATDVGDVGEVLLGGQLGRLVPTEDQKALTGAMNDLYDMKSELRDKLAQECQESVKERYSIERIVDEWMCLYQEAISFHSRAKKAG
jgi:glycosyltransferase involved in cell wall biosynthesis